jgi:hypothetical protein
MMRMVDSEGTVTLGWGDKEWGVPLNFWQKGEGSCKDMLFIALSGHKNN